MFEASTLFSDKEIVVGFDLGTTNSVVSLYTDALPKIIPIDGEDLIPSFVEFDSNKKLISIGREAKKNRQGEYTVFSFKKFMGTDKKLLWDFTAEDIATIFVAEVFSKLRQQHDHLKDVNAAVVSVPAYFNINQINSTKQAFRRNGIRVIDVHIEPVSAALVYQEIKAITGTILVFDLGGGTFDAVLIANTPGIPKESIALYKAAGIDLPDDTSKLSIIDITGMNRLGGDDIDEEAIRLYRQATASTRADKELRVIAEIVKHTGKTSGDFLFEYVEQATDMVLKTCMDLVTRMLNKNNVQKVHCVLCGGSTKSKVVKDTLKKQFRISSEIDPDLSVSIGNSMYARKGRVIQRTPKYIGILSGGKFKPVVPKGTIIPASKVVYVTNTVPWDNTVDIKFYQANSLISEKEHISTLEVAELPKFDRDGFATIGVNIDYLIDGTINARVESGGKTYHASLSYVDSAQTVQEPTLITMTRKANSKLKDAELTRLLEEWDETKDETLVAQMNKRLIACRKK